MRLEGKLSSASGETVNFSSYRVEAYFTQRLRSSTDVLESIHLFASAVVNSDGSFAVELPSRDQLEDTLELQVFTPDGERLETVKRMLAALKEGEVIKIAVKPKQFPTIIENPDPFLGCKVKLRGLVITEDGKGVTGRSLALWSRLKGSEPQIILTSTTDKNGRFSADYPVDEFEEAYAVVNVGGDSKDTVTIHLQNGKVPQKLILVVRNVKDLNDGTECDCETEIPRTPDTDDMIDSPGTYSTDIGGGRCVDFTAPNRTFEEFTFSLVVRTTEPTIKGLTLDDPNTWHNRLTYRLVDSFLDVKNSVDKSTHAESIAANEAATTSTREVIKNIHPGTLKSLAKDPESITRATLANSAMRDIANSISKDLGRPRTITPSRGHLTTDNPIDWDDEPTFYQATSIAIGHLVQYKQKWKADGYSMGNLLYSVPLGPCQKKQIAIVDWERREIARRAETLEERENLNALISRDRAISDIVSGALTEGIHAKSQASNWGASGGFGLDLGIFSIGGGGGGSGSDSEAWQDSARNISTLALNNLSDSTSQSASAFRSQHGTVVQTIQQGERVTATTDVISNNNHCHAITIEYFEILRHFLVTHDCANVQECLFIPLLLSKFDLSKTLRWKTILRAFLRDQSLVGGFDAVDRVYHNWDGSDLPEHRYSDEDILTVRGELRLYIYIPKPKDKEVADIGGSHFAPREEEWKPLVDAGLLDGFIAGDAGGGGADLGTRIWNDRLNDNRAPDQPAKERIFQLEIAPYIATRFIDTQLEFYFRKAHTLRAQREELEPANIDATLMSVYSPDSELFVRLRSEGGQINISRASIIDFVIRMKRPPNAQGFSVLPPGSRFVIASSAMNYHSSHMDHPLYSEVGVNDDLISSNETSFSTPTDHEENRDPHGEDRESSRRLILHLNEYLEFYHKVIWINMDKDRRFMLLDGFIAPNSNGKSVASVVENRLIGIVGNSLIMPVSAGFHLDPTYRIEKINDLRHSYASSVPPLSIAIPCRGVFAESVMGKCNSCETKDDSRFWKFEESPCGMEPTSIAPVSTETRRAEPGDLRPQQFPTPLVSLQNIPSAPDPTGLDAALRVLGTSNLFPNLTGLDQTQKNALGALLSSADLAKTFMKEAATSARQQRMLKEGGIEKALQKIKETEESKGITADQAKELRVEALRAMTGLESKDVSSVTKKPEIDKILDQAKDFDTMETTISSPGESASVKTSSSPSSKKGASSGINLERIRRARAAIPTGEGGIEIEGDMIRGRILFSNFDVNSNDLKAEFYVPLNMIAELVNSSENAKLYLEGHASQTGPENFNQILSENRANEIYSHLVNVLGINREKVLDVIGLGSTDPILNARGIEEQLNRSVLLVYSVPEPDVRPENFKPDRPQPDPQGSTRWGIRQFSSIEMGAGIGGALATFELKNMETGETRKAGFIGGGFVGGFKKKFVGGGSVSSQGDFTEFHTENKITFEAFNGTLARFTTLGGGVFFLGYSFTYLSLPLLGSEVAPEGPNSINVGGVTFGSVGVSGGFPIGVFALA